MTVIAIREVTPEIGKEELAESRMRRAAGVMAPLLEYSRWRQAAVQEIIIFKACIHRLRRAHVRSKALVRTLNFKQYSKRGR